MGPIVRLVSLVLVLGTWYALSGRPVQTSDLPKAATAVAAASEQVLR